MTDVAVDVSGDMVTSPILTTKGSGFASFLQFPTQVPDPKDWLQQQRQNVRPWLLFVHTNNFKAPPSVSRLSRRIMRNIEYFQSNYVFVFLGLVAYCLITSPLLLLAICGSLYAGYKLSQRHKEKKFVLFGKELSLAQQYGIICLCSLPVYFWVGAPGAMFWVLGASFFVITLHAGFYNIDALISEEESLNLTQDV